jgi:tetraacyldisaccharide 4'-kinase
MEDHRNILFYPLSVLYGLITSLRNFLYNTGILPSFEFNNPIISIGNITVGGTGKTPHTEYLISILNNKYRIATLSRGYKRKTHDFRIASSSSDVNEIGDEPLQIFRKFPEIIVSVSKDRVKGVRKILETNPATEVIILDDAFQHRKIVPGFSILLTDYSRLITNDHMLPYGNMREHKWNMNRADVILITKSPVDLSPINRRLIIKDFNIAAYQNIFFTSLSYKDPVPVFNQTDNDNPKKTVDFSESSIVLVTGIANPVTLAEYIKKSAVETIHLQFPDHYSYRKKDIEKICSTFNNLEAQKKYLITTEKDAVRFMESADINEPLRSLFYYIPIGIDFLFDQKGEFDNLIIDYVRKNHRNNKVS